LRDPRVKERTIGTTMADSKSSKDIELQETEEREFHETFCNGSPGCQHPGCAERRVQEMDDAISIAYSSDDEYEETSQENLYEEPGTVCQDTCLNCKANPSKDGVCICREGDSE